MAGKFNIGDVVRPIKTKSDAGVTLTPQDEVMVTGSSTLLGGIYVFGGRTFHNNSGYTHDIIGDDVDFELVSVANGVNPSSSPLPASSTTARPLFRFPQATSPKFKIGDRVVALKDDPNLLFLPKGTIVEVVNSAGNIPLAHGEFYYRVLGDTTVRVGREDDFDHLYSTHAIQFVAPAATSPTVAQYFGDGTTLQLEEVQNNVEKCECGSSLVGSPYHSTWCPLFKP